MQDLNDRIRKKISLERWRALIGSFIIRNTNFYFQLLTFCFFNTDVTIKETGFKLFPNSAPASIKKENEVSNLNFVFVIYQPW